MHTPSRILVPVDFTESSRAALEYAALLGSRLGAEVDMLHVWRPEHAASKEEVLSEFMQSDAGHDMMEWLASCEVRGDVVTHGRIAEGAHSQIPDAIVEVVESCAYDLVVMATHGRQGLSLLLRGSVTEKVVRRAPCPVITIRAPDGDLPADPRGAGLDVASAWTWPPV
jgi:universal stress protein A